MASCLTFDDILARPQQLKKHREVPSPLRYLQNRELHRTKSNADQLEMVPGFSIDAVRSMEYSFRFTHGGCVNTASFNENGTLLVTGSDDLVLNIWKSSNFIDPGSVARKYEIITGHNQNIFHALFAPDCNSRNVASCAADGLIRWHDVENPAAEKSLASLPGLANMFVFYDANVILATNFQRMFTSLGGTVEHIDIRDPANSFSLLQSNSAQVKAIDICPWDHHTVAVGVGEEVWLCDARMQSDQASSSSSSGSLPTCVKERLGVEGILQMEALCKSAIGTFLPYHGREPDFQGSQFSQSYQYITSRKRHRPVEDISISSIEFSKQRRELLVSYQGDSVYRFSCDPAKPFGQGSVCPTPAQFFAGHVNEDTFLKKAAYFGPNEEYVCCGGDDGNVFVYSSSTGDLVSCKKGDGFDEQMRSYHGIVNGVVPHPFSNSFVSYGLDSYAKLWTVPEPKDAADEEDEEGSSDREDNSSGEVSGRAGRGSVKRHKRLFEHINRSLKKTQMHAVERGGGGFIQPSSKVTPMLLHGLLIRCSRIRENAASGLLMGKTAIPSSSLILAAFDDGERAIALSDLYGAERVEYCVRKTEEVREEGNVAFHDGKFRDALELYTVAAHYCLGACYLHEEMLTVFNEDVDEDRKILLEKLDDVARDKSVFEVNFPTKNFAKKNRIDPPDAAVLARIVQAVEKIWELFLITSQNAAQAALKLKSYHLALRFAEQAIEIDTTSSKARFRKGMALRGMGWLADALAEFKRVRNLPDGNTDLVKNMIQDLSTRLANKKSG